LIGGVGERRWRRSGSGVNDHVTGLCGEPGGELVPPVGVKVQGSVAAGQQPGGPVDLDRQELEEGGIGGGGGPFGDPVAGGFGDAKRGGELAVVLCV
jgi:hypothetical protein